jgi:predicted metalloprotease with PDZ domain
VLPYDEAFAYVGLRLLKTQAKDPYDLGLSLQLGPMRQAIITNVRNNSPAENAGLQAGDVITSFPARETVERYKPGDSVPVTVKRDRLTIKTNIVVGQPEVFDYRIEEKPDATVEQKALRAAWLRG